MYVLGLDSATLAASAAVINPNKLVAERFVHNKLTHSETLMPIIQQTLADAGITPQELGGIAVTCGPGSFTGLRIGLAVAKGLAQVLSCPLVGISTLDTLAFNLVGSKGLICPILDAKKQQVYTALYQTDKQDPLELQQLIEYQALSVESLVEVLSAFPAEQITFLGDGVPVYGDQLLQNLGSRAGFAAHAHNMPRAAAVAELGLRRIAAGEDDGWFSLNPMYLRASEAETTWTKRHGGCQER